MQRDYFAKVDVDELACADEIWRTETCPVNTYTLSRWKRRRRNTKPTVSRMKNLKSHGSTSLHDIIPTLAATSTPRTTLVDHRPALPKLRRQNHHSSIVGGSLIRQELGVDLLLIRKTRAAHRIAYRRTATPRIKVLAHGHNPIAQLILVDELEVGRDPRQSVVLDTACQRHRGALDLGQFAHEGPVQLLFDLCGWTLRQDWDAGTA